MNVISLKELKLDTGHFDSIFKTFEEQIILCEKEGYSKEVGRLVRLLVDFGFLDYDDWQGKEYDEQRDQINNSALWATMFIIRLNNIAQRDLNGMKMGPTHEQLNGDPNLANFFKDTTFVE